MIDSAQEISANFVEVSLKTLEQYRSRIEDCLSRLTPEQIWTRSSENENSIGNLVLHLCGNVTQWIASGIANRPDNRDRNSEFAAQRGMSPQQLSSQIHDVVVDAVKVVRTLTPQRLSEMVTPQGYTVSVLEAVYHVVEHFALHAGQIMFATKMLTGDDLGYYRDLAKTGRLESN